MDRWIDVLIRGGVTSFGGVGIAFALLLIVALRILLPAPERKSIRTPVVFLALHVAVVVLRAALSGVTEVQGPLKVAALFLLLGCIAKAGFIFVVDWFLGRRLARPFSKIVRDIILVLVYVGVAIITLRAMGAEVGSLLTTSALLTAVIGLSLQETLGNLFAGLAMQAQRPFEIGDWIQFDQDPAHVGRVTEINWRATKVLTNDQVELIVPNGILAKAPIANFTQPSRVSRRIVNVQAPYEAPAERVQAVLLEAVTGTAGVLEQPPPFVLLVDFADSGIEYWLHYFIDEFERRNHIDSRVRVRIWYAFKRTGISIPFPIRDVRTQDTVAVGERDQERRMVRRTRLLRRVDFLDLLPEETIAKLAALTEVRLYAQGEEVIRQGEEGDELFIIERGHVAVLLAKDKRRVVEVAQLGSGKFFGEMSLMTGEARSATVRALEECELVVVGHTAFKEVLMAAPELAERISEVLAKRQAQLDERASNPSVVTGQETARSGVLLKRIRDFFSL